nr:nucleotidyltransferase domain-containing protein [Paenibacillus wynnii]
MYVLRPILACEWIQQYNTMPPSEFHSQVDVLVPLKNYSVQH